MSDPVLELHSGSDVVLLARSGASLGRDARATDCALPALMRALALPDNLIRLRSNWSAVCRETIQIRQLSDEALVEKVAAEVACGRVKAMRRPVETFGFVLARGKAAAPAPRDLPKERVTPSMRAIPQPPSKPQLPKPTVMPEAPPMPEAPAPADLLPHLPKLPDPPKLPEAPDAAALEDMASAAAAKVAQMDELAEQRALVGELIDKGGKAAEIAKKVIELRNASKEEIAAFAMQMAAEHGEDIPPEYREMLREYGTAENISKAEDKAEKAADSASDLTDRL